MVFLNINIGDGKISFRHFQGGMPEDTLEHYRFAAKPQVVNRERMPEAMDRCIFDP